MDLLISHVWAPPVVEKFAFLRYCTPCHHPVSHVAPGIHINNSVQFTR
jgi:hypothetical protein